MHERWVDLDGAANVRDLGGLEVEGGGRTAAGIMLRADNLQGLTVGTILVVTLAVLAAVTVLPATLSLLGSRVDRGRIPWLGRRRLRSRFWATVADVVTRRPAVWSGVATALLVLLTLHEFGHAWTAWKCGDDTAKRQLIANALLTRVGALPQKE